MASRGCEAVVAAASEGRRKHPDNGSAPDSASKLVLNGPRPAAPEMKGVYIQQAAAMVGASASALRQWEESGLIHPSRTPSGYRIYTAGDIDRLRRVQQLLADGINLSGVHRLLEDNGASVTAHHSGESSSLGGVGPAVRAFRFRHEMTLRDLAEVTALSPSYISAVERSLTSPSIASLQKLAKALGTNVLTLLGEGRQAPEQPVTRAGERPILQSNKGVTIEDLSIGKTDLEPIIMTIEPGCGSDGPLSHAGEEFLYMLKGAMRLRLDGTDDYDLSVGDGMAYDSVRPHQFSNVSDEPAVVIWINTPRTF